MKRSRTTAAVYGAAFAAAVGLHVGVAAALGLLGAGAHRPVPDPALLVRQEPLAVSFLHPQPVELRPKAAVPVTRLRKSEPQPAIEPPLEPPPPAEPAEPQPDPPLPAAAPPDLGLADDHPSEALSRAPHALDPSVATASRAAAAEPMRSRGAAAPVATIVKPRPLVPIDAEAVYPLGSRLRGEEGIVRLSVSIDPRGRIELLKVVGSSGFAALDRAAEKAVRQTRFAPATRNERPVADELVIAIRFRLES